MKGTCEQNSEDVESIVADLLGRLAGVQECALDCLELEIP
jgi:hypothetical protein